MEKFVDVVGKVAGNVWAFLLFLLAAAVAIVAHFGHNDHLLTFAGTIATTGGTLFSMKGKPE